MALVTILGDVHGGWDHLKDAMDQNPKTDLFIQVGDFGYWKNLGRDIPNLDRPLLFVDGNHEDHPGLKKVELSGNLEVAQNVFYIPRGSHFEYEGATFNCIGGAQSIDRWSRIVGRDWFPGEVPTYEEFSKFVELPKADYIIAHTAPFSVIEQCFAMTPNENYASVEKSLEAIWNQMDYTPKGWFFGHWHYPMDKVVNGTRFMCLPCVHDVSFAGMNIPASIGYSIEL
jgi:hypothetical protein